MQFKDYPDEVALESVDLSRTRAQTLLDQMANATGIDVYGQEDPDTWSDVRVQKELSGLIDTLWRCGIRVREDEEGPSPEYIVTCDRCQKTSSASAPWREEALRLLKYHRIMSDLGGSEVLCNLCYEKERHSSRW